MRKYGVISYCGENTKSSRRLANGSSKLGAIVQRSLYTKKQEKSEKANVCHWLCTRMSNAVRIAVYYCCCQTKLLNF
jgi:hypothetical protein